MTQRGLILLHILLIGVLGCEKKTDRFYEGELIRINFETSADYTTDHWIEVNGLLINHVDNQIDRLNLPYSLPTSDYKFVAYKNDDPSSETREYSLKADNIQIAVDLLGVLAKAHRDSVLKSHFSFISHAEASLAARIQLFKVDSSSFYIKVPDDYPGTITVLEF